MFYCQNSLTNCLRFPTVLITSIKNTLDSTMACMLVYWTKFHWLYIITWLSTKTLPKLSIETSPDLQKPPHSNFVCILVLLEQFWPGELHWATLPGTMNEAGCFVLNHCELVVEWLLAEWMRTNCGIVSV